MRAGASKGGARKASLDRRRQGVPGTAEGVTRPG